MLPARQQSRIGSVPPKVFLLLLPQGDGLRLASAVLLPAAIRLGRSTFCQALPLLYLEEFIRG